jgi:hypothetical protein
MSDRDPRMLPGPTAKRVSTIAGVLGTVSLGSLLVGFVGLSVLRILVDPDKSRVGAILALIGFALIALFVVILPICIPVGLRAKRIEELELIAGYTTLLTQFDQVDGIDSRTGQVVRPAKLRTVGSPVQGSVTTGIELGAIEGIRTPLQIALRVWPASAGFFGSIIVLVVSLAEVWVGVADNTAFNWLLGASLILLILAIFPIVMIPIFVLTIAPSRRYVMRLTAEYPSARVMPGEFAGTEFIEELVEPDAPALPFAKDRVADYFVFAAEQLIAYSRCKTELLPFLVIPRSRITAARLGSVPNWRGPEIPAAVFVIRKDNGSTADMTLNLALMVAGSDAVSTPKKIRPSVDWAIAWATGPAGR